MAQTFPVGEVSPTSLVNTLLCCLQPLRQHLDPSPAPGVSWPKAPAQMPFPCQASVVNLKATRLVKTDSAWQKREPSSGGTGSFQEARGRQEGLGLESHGDHRNLPRASLHPVCFCECLEDQARTMTGCEA